MLLQPSNVDLHYRAQTICQFQASPLLDLAMTSANGSGALPSPNSIPTNSFGIHLADQGGERLATTIASSLYITPAQLEQSVEENKDSKHFEAQMHLSGQTCKGCGMEIRDRFFLRVFDQFWHEQCLCCSACEKPLNGSNSCYLKKDRVYCKEDHTMLFATKCARCQVVLKPTDCVYRCLQFIFHADCFQCTQCRHVLQRGDQYYCVDGQLLCQTDYMQMLAGSSSFYCSPPMMRIATPLMNGASVPMIGDVVYPPPNSHSYKQPESSVYYEAQSQSHARDKKQPKRPRTILNAAQRKSFKIAFEKSPKPSRKVREQLAKETGLSVRVVQVWMQNQRAKLKKEQRKRDTASVMSNSVTGSNSTDSEPKSIAEDELKSVGGSLDDGFDSEEYAETLSGRSSTLINQPAAVGLPSLSTPDFLVSLASRPDATKYPTPISKLYEMQHTYFALA